MNDKKLKFMELFVKGKVNFKTYNRIIIYLDMLGE